MNGIKTMKHLIRGVLTWGILMVLLVGCEISKLPFIGESDVSGTFPVAVNLTQTPEAIGTFVAASADGSPTAEASATALPTAMPTATLTPFPAATDTGKPTTVAVPPSATVVVPPSATIVEVEFRAASEQNTATPEPEATAVAVEPTATTPPTAVVIKPTIRLHGSLITQPLAEQAMALLAQESGLPAGQFTVSQHKIEWPDSSLGCPQPGMMYLQVLSNGFVIVIQGNGQTYYVHKDQGGQLFVCNTPDPKLKKMIGD